MSISATKISSSPKTWDKVKYPIHGIRKETSKDKPYIVLFMAESNGIVVSSINDKHPVGQYSTFWGMKQFDVAPSETYSVFTNP